MAFGGRMIGGLPTGGDALSRAVESGVALQNADTQQYAVQSQVLAQREAQKAEIAQQAYKALNDQLSAVEKQIVTIRDHGEVGPNGERLPVDPAKLSEALKPTFEMFAQTAAQLERMSPQFAGLSQSLPVRFQSMLTAPTAREQAALAAEAAGMVEGAKAGAKAAATAPYDRAADERRAALEFETSAALEGVRHQYRASELSQQYQHDLAKIAASGEQQRSAGAQQYQYDLAKIAASGEQQRATDAARTTVVAPGSAVVSGGSEVYRNPVQPSPNYEPAQRKDISELRRKFMEERGQKIDGLRKAVGQSERVLSAIKDGWKPGKLAETRATIGGYVKLLTGDSKIGEELADRLQTGDTEQVRAALQSLVFDALGGLGAQISDADRDFIVGSIGRIDDPVEALRATVGYINGVSKRYLGAYNLANQAMEAGNDPKSLYGAIMGDPGAELPDSPEMWTDGMYYRSTENIPKKGISVGDVLLFKDGRLIKQ